MLCEIEGGGNGMLVLHQEQGDNALVWDRRVLSVPRRWGSLRVDWFRCRYGTSERLTPSSSSS